MGNLKLELNSAGIQALLKSQEIMNELQKEAEKIRSELGEGFQTGQYIGRNRGNVSVYTTDPGAIQDNLRNNSVLKALGVSTASERRTGKKVEGYWRKGKNGEKIWVKPYQRRT